MTHPALNFDPALLLQAQGVRVDTQSGSAPYKAAAGLASVVAEGLSAIGQEMVKTEQQKADLSLHEGLAALSKNLAEKPSLTPAEVREALGNDITPDVEQHLTNQDGTEVQDIPTWKVAGAILGACWAQERNIADPEVLQTLLREQNLPAACWEASKQSDVQARYAQNTQHAIDAQVFGSPSYVVNGEIFWGQDRLDLLAKRLLGH